MKKRRLCGFLSLLIAAAILSSCGGSPAPEKTDKTEENTSAVTDTVTETVTESETTAPETKPDADETMDYDALSEEEYRNLVITESIVTTGNTDRIKNVFERADKGEEITVAYIGGSITEGYNSDVTKCWAQLSFNELSERFPTSKMNYVNAGMSGTPSIVGLIRCERDVIAPYGNPDIVFIEFAVNDAQDSTSKEAYESLVKRMLGLPNNPAVILLFTQTKTGYNCQEHMSEIGNNYGLPMISVPDSLGGEFESGRMDWSLYSDDEAHPNIYGHRYIADMIKRLYDYVEKDFAVKDKDKAFWDRDNSDLSAIKPHYGDAFVNMHLLDSSNLTPVSMGEYKEKTALSQFPNGWVRKGGENEGIVFEIECESLFILYHCQNSNKYGTAEVYVDGERTTTVKSSSPDGWSNPVAQLIFEGDGVEKHRVEIKMAKGNEDTYFGILGFGYTN